jgi:hypothetical protein
MQIHVRLSQYISPPLTSLDLSVHQRSRLIVQLQRNLIIVRALLSQLLMFVTLLLAHNKIRHVPLSKLQQSLVATV